MLSAGLGTIIWTSVAFLIVVFLLKKMAWGPILETLRERENEIDQSLQAAEEAKRQMEELKSDNEKLIKEARLERDQILKQAKEAKEAMISEAKAKAKEEADKLIANAKATIETEKKAALSELKNSVAGIALEIAEKVVRERLSDDAKQVELVNSLVKDININ